MKVVKSIEEFKEFMKDNCELIHANAIKGDNISPDDEWMQDNIWDEIYQEEVVDNRKI